MGNRHCRTVNTMGIDIFVPEIIHVGVNILRIEVLHVAPTLCTVDYNAIIKRIKHSFPCVIVCQACVATRSAKLCGEML